MAQFKRPCPERVITGRVRLSSLSDFCSISSSFLSAFMAFKIYGSVDIKYLPEIMGVQVPSNFLRDWAWSFDPAQIVQTQCKSASISCLFSSCIFQPCTLRPDACPTSSWALAFAVCFFIHADIAFVDAASWRAGENIEYFENHRSFQHLRARVPL